MANVHDQPRAFGALPRGGDVVAPTAGVATPPRPASAAERGAAKPRPASPIKPLAAGASPAPSSSPSPAGALVVAPGVAEVVAGAVEKLATGARDWLAPGSAPLQRRLGQAADLQAVHVRALDRPGMGGAHLSRALGVSRGLLAGEQRPAVAAPIAANFGDILLRCGRVHDAAVQYHRALQLAPHAASVMVGLGHALYWANPAVALEHAAAALRLNPDSPGAWALLALAESAHDGLLGDAHDDLHVALELERLAGGGGGHRDALCTVAEAVVRRRCGEHEHALALLDDDLAAGRENYLAQAVAAEIHLEAGDVAAADTLVGQILTATPLSALARLLRARLALRAGDAAAALQGARGVAQREPEMLAAWRLQATAAVLAGDRAAHAEALDAVVALDPADHDSRRQRMDHDVVARRWDRIVADHALLPAASADEATTREVLALATLFVHAPQGAHDGHPMLAAWRPQAAAGARPVPAAAVAPPSPPGADPAAGATDAYLDNSVVQLQRLLDRATTSFERIMLHEQLDSLVRAFPAETRFLVMRGEVQLRDGMYRDARADFDAALAIDGDCTAARKGRKAAVEARREAQLTTLGTVLGEVGKVGRSVAATGNSVMNGVREVRALLPWWLR